MFIGLYCRLLVRVHPLSLAWANLHHTDSLWALFQGLIVEFRLGYPIFYLGISEIFALTNSMCDCCIIQKGSNVMNYAEAK